MNDSNGHSLGNIKETCWWCIPKFDINTSDGTREYNLHPPSCCCGTAINCFAMGCCNCCKVPFDVIDAVSGERVGRITKVWSGAVKETFTDADHFETDFPLTATAAAKARLLGAVFLLNQVFFEDSHHRAGRG